MDTDLSRKIVVVSVCLGFCVFAQAQVQGPVPTGLEPGLPSRLRQARLPGQSAEQRLPGELPPPFALKWGTTGAGDGEFDLPVSVAVDTSGNVYVSDINNHRIQKFDSSGTFITEWGTSGTGDGEFNYALGVAVDLSGNVYVTDTNNNRVQKFDSSGAFIAKWGTLGTGDGEFANPIGVAVDASGTFARVLTVPADTTGAQDSPVLGHSTYIYRVMACNVAGCSPPSAEVSVTTPALGIFIGEEEGQKR